MKQLHEYAKFFPPMEGEEFKALCQDVKDHGLINPIVLEDDQILDGRNRARACDEVGVRPKYEELKNGISPLEYVISQNVLRRHLTSSQRSILALELEEKFAEEIKAKGKKRDPKISAETKEKDDGERGRAAAKAAKALHIGSVTVKYAKRLAKTAPKFIPAVRAGKLSVKEALLQARDEKVKKNIERDKVRAKERRRERESKQVAAYLDASKSYIVALKLAIGDVEEGLFSPEACRFVVRKLDETRELMDEFENKLKKIQKKGGE